MRTPTSGFSGAGQLDGEESRVFGPELGDFGDHADQQTAAATEDATMKTGTTTVGLKTDDGVVLATDMRASMGYMVSSKDVQKVEEMHTFSAEGSMFSITSSDPRQRKLLSNLYVPMVFGIEKSLRGTALGYYQQQGFISFGLEGGQHENELTEYNITASLLLLLHAVGAIEKQYVEKIKEYERHLKEHTQHLPVETELVYQHIIEPGDGFAMRPGYSNFEPIKKGEWLANDNEGKIIAQTDGYILMPLYQKQGNDGFFIIKENEG